MGKIRTKLIGLEEVEKKQKEDAKVRREEKKKREGVKVKPSGGKGGERMKQVEVSEEALKKMEKAKEILEKPSFAKATEAEEKTTPKKIKKRSRGRNYLAAKKKIDKNKKYDVKTAISILQKIKFTKFDETIELHINTKENNIKGEVILPRGTGKETRVAIVDDKILAEIEKGNLNFDVLVTHPSYMPKLVKFAKVLGPKGLMPNPKAGTISDKPKEAAKKFKGGAIRFKTEIKFPIIHQAVGKLSFKEEDLAKNITVFLKAVGISKIASAFLKSSMSPSILLDIDCVK
jgi:large subunit ribosomal protein L1